MGDYAISSLGLQSASNYVNMMQLGLHIAKAQPARPGGRRKQSHAG